eukprot:PhM_4_TR3290/c0_g1_i1/m.86426
MASRMIHELQSEAVPSLYFPNYSSKRRVEPRVLQTARTYDEQQKFSEHSRRSLERPVTSTWSAATQRDMDETAVRYFLAGTTKNTDELFVDNAPKFDFLSNRAWRPAGKSIPHAPETARAPPKVTHPPVSTPSARLLRGPAPPTPLKPLVPRRPVSREKEAALVKRLYDQAVKRQEAFARDVEQRMAKDKLPVRVLEDEGEFAERLMYNPLKARDAEMARLMKPIVEHGGNEKKGASNNKNKKERLTEEESAALTERVYRRAIERKENALRKMEEKYLTSRTPKFGRLTPKQIKASAERLSTVTMK